MEKNKLREVAEDIFGYNPGFFKEEFACTVGPLLAKIGLNNLMPNVSKPLSKEEISQEIKRKDLGISPEEIIQLQPWYISGGHMRAIEESDQNKYILGSYFEN